MVDSESNLILRLLHSQTHTERRVSHLLTAIDQEDRFDCDLATALLIFGFLMLDKNLSDQVVQQGLTLLKDNNTDQSFYDLYSTALINQRYFIPTLQQTASNDWKQAFSLSRSKKSEVTLSWDDHLQMRVVIKMQRATERHTGVSEGIVMARFTEHESVTRVYDAFSIENIGESNAPKTLFTVMEFLTERGFYSLGDLLGWRFASHPALSYIDVQLILEQLANFLECQRQKMIDHRDLTPANLFYRPTFSPGGGQLKVIDFGASNQVYLLPEGYLVGYPNYFTPELVNQHTTTGKSDVYYLTTLLFELLTGSKVFSVTMDANQVIAAIGAEVFPDTDTRSLKMILIEAIIKRALMMPSNSDEDRNTLQQSLYLSTPPEIEAIWQTIRRGLRAPETQPFMTVADFIAQVNQDLGQLRHLRLLV